MIAALFLGLGVSLHCAGMCGPLLLALPLDAATRRSAALQMLVYHTGRIAMYMTLGLLFGALGKGLAMAGFQQALSLASGILMLVISFAAWRFERIAAAIPGFNQLTRQVQQAIGRLLRRQGAGAMFSIGLLNGLLPCGMVYAALAGAVAAANGPEGAVFMGFFGLGTLPLLLAVHWLGRSFQTAIRPHIRLIQPVLFLVAGLLLLQRCLHIDISLFESAVPGAIFECH